MHAILNHAMRWDFAHINPTTLVRTVREADANPEVLPAEAIGALLSELKDPWRTAVYVALTTGLRVSELLGVEVGGH